MDKEMLVDKLKCDMKRYDTLASVLSGLIQAVETGKPETLQNTLDFYKQGKEYLKASDKKNIQIVLDVIKGKELCHGVDQKISSETKEGVVNAQDKEGLEQVGDGEGIEGEDNQGRVCQDKVVGEVNPYGITEYPFDLVNELIAHRNIGGTKPFVDVFNMFIGIVNNPTTEDALDVLDSYISDYKHILLPEEKVKIKDYYEMVVNQIDVAMGQVLGVKRL